MKLEIFLKMICHMDHSDVRNKSYGNMNVHKSTPVHISEVSHSRCDCWFCSFLSFLKYGFFRCGCMVAFFIS